MNNNISLVDLLNDVSNITTGWIKKNVVNSQNCGNLTNLVDYALKSTVPGNDRALMVKLGCELKGKGINIALPAMAAWELLNISLIVTDDFYDQRTSNRMGKKTIYSIWGTESCVSLGFVLNSLSCETLIKAHNKDSRWNIHDAIEVLHWAMKWLYYSQFQEEQLMKVPLSKVTFKMYLDMVNNATSVGIAGAFELGGVIGGANRHERQIFRNYATYIGHLAQIRDDFVDYIYAENLIKKGAFNDLYTKKRRLPILVAYWVGTPKEKNLIEKMFLQDTIDKCDALNAIDLVTSQKVTHKVRQIVDQLKAKANHYSRSLPNVQPAKSVLNDLLDMFTDL